MFFSQKSLSQAFQLSDLNKSGAVVDVKKLQWLNGQHLKKMLDEAETQDEEDGFWWKRSSLKEREDVLLSQIHLPGLSLEYTQDRDYTLKVLRLLQDRVRLVKHLARPMGAHFFMANHECEAIWTESEDMKLDVYHPFMSTVLREALHQVKTEGESDYAKVIALVQDIGQLKKKQVLMPLRWALTGTPVGVDMAKTMELLGYDRVVYRLERALDSGWD